MHSYFLSIDRKFCFSRYNTLGHYTVLCYKSIQMTMKVIPLMFENTQGDVVYINGRGTRLIGSGKGIFVRVIFKLSY